MNKVKGVRRCHFLTACLVCILSLSIGVSAFAEDAAADRAGSGGWEGFNSLLTRIDSLTAENEPTLNALAKELDSVRKLLSDYRQELLFLKSQMTAMNDFIKEQEEEKAVLKANLEAISDSEEFIRQLDDAREKSIQLDSALILIDTYEETIANLEADRQEQQKRVDELIKENEELKSKMTD